MGTWSQNSMISKVETASKKLLAVYLEKETRKKKNKKQKFGEE